MTVAWVAPWSWGYVKYQSLLHALMNEITKWAVSSQIFSWHSVAWSLCQLMSSPHGWSLSKRININNYVYTLQCKCKRVGIIRTNWHNVASDLFRFVLNTDSSQCGPIKRDVEERVLPEYNGWLSSRRVTDVCFCQFKICFNSEKSNLHISLDLSRHNGTISIF